MFAGTPARSELMFTTKESSLYEDHTKSVHTNERRRTMKQHRSAEVCPNTLYRVNQRTQASNTYQVRNAKNTTLCGKYC